MKCERTIDLTRINSSEVVVNSILKLDLVNELEATGLWILFKQLLIANE